MHRILLFLTCLIFHISLFGQNAFYDAQTLYQLDKLQIKALDDYRDLLPQEKDVQDWINIKKFVRDPFEYIAENEPSFNVDVIFTLQQLSQKYDIIDGKTGMARYKRKPNANDFLVAGPAQTADVGYNLLESIFSANLGPEFGTELIDATATLLYERTNAELTLSYLSRIKTTFEGKAFQVENKKFYLKDLFPSTYNLLVDYDKVLSINVGKSLQNALEEDLKDFFDNADTYLIPENSKKKLPYMLFSALYFSFKDLNKGFHPAVLITSLARKFPIDESIPPANQIDTFTYSIHLLHRITQSLEDISSERVWIGMDDFKKLNIREIEYYICLLYITNHQLFKNLGIKAQSLSEGKDSWNFIKLRNTIYRTMELIDQMENKIAGLRHDASKTNNKTERGNTQQQAVISDARTSNLRGFYEYGFMFLDLLEQSVELVCWVSEEEHLVCKGDFETVYLPALEELLQIPLFVENKEYGTAFFKTFKVLKILAKDKYQTPEGLIKYLTLAADIVAADSVDQIKSILDAAILPIGSFRVKRYSNRSVFINAYVGAGLGSEWIDNAGITDKWGYQFSPFAPIGIDVSWGSRKTSADSPFQTKGRSSSLFVSIVDLGAVVSYRFQTNTNPEDTLTVGSLPSIQWEHLLSPGVFYVRGFKNSPLAWGIGAQMTPQLRDIKSLEDITLDRANAFRFSTFIAVDLPLLTISSKNDGEIVSIDMQRQIVNQLQREKDELTSQMLVSTSDEERKRLRKAIKSKDKALKKEIKKLDRILLD